MQIGSLLNVCMSISVDAALEIQLPLNCRHMKQGLEIKSRCGEISKKYSNYQLK